MKIKKITSINDYYTNQITVLKALNELDGLSEKTKELIEIKKNRQYIFAALLLAGAKMYSLNENIVIKGEEYEVPGVFSLPREELLSFSFLSDKINKLEAMPVEEEEATENAEEIAEETEPDVQTEEAVLKTESESVVKKEWTNSGLEFIHRDKTVKDWKEEYREKGILFESEHEQLKEPEFMKYKDSMWFQKYDIICTEKTAYSPIELSLIIYPLELTGDRKTVKVAVVLQHKNAHKIAFSTDEKWSIEISYEHLSFYITGKFIDGEFKPIIDLANGEFKIQSKELVFACNGPIVPNVFSKNLQLDDDLIELYPLDINNHKTGGNAPCLYRHIMPDKTELGYSNGEDSIMLGLSNGGASNICCYWNGDGQDRRVIVDVN